ncbi:MAG: CotH kinase family protein [Acutalibacteraceae bacterium]
MKYKITGIIVCIAVLLASFYAPHITKAEKTRYHQHIEAEDKTPCFHGSEVFCTHLPLVMIDTSGKEIPGKAVKNEAGELVYTTAEDGSEEITAQLKIADNPTENNHTDSAAAVTSDIRIHARGNSSRTFDKLGYAIRLITADGKSNPQSVMGMDAHHEWALHGPFIDKTLIRNYMWYNIAGEIMDYAPNVRFCEVMLNGEYQGVYVMTEIITAGDDGARLKLSVNKKDNTFSGYLLKLDRGSNTDIKNISTFTSYSLRTKQNINIEYPGISNLTPALAESIRQDFSRFEKALYSYDFDNEDYGYKRYIDTESFADYFIINEFTCNYDAGLFSTYIYKDIDGKYRMCIWDFNSACDNYQESAVLPDDFEMQYRLWYFMLMMDEDFTDLIIRRYRELRKTYLSEEYLYGYIDGCTKYLGEAIERNFGKWGYTFEPEYDPLTPADRNPRSYDEAVEQLKEFIKARGDWMDENIETLRQYSENSKIKKYNEAAN